MEGSFKNYQELKLSEICGCYYCINIYPPYEILEWVDNGQTALCPYCGIDSVIGDKNGLIINKIVLEELHKYWFSNL